MAIKIVPSLIALLIIGSLTYLFVFLFTHEQRRRRAVLRHIESKPQFVFLGKPSTSLNRIQKRISSGQLQMDRLPTKDKKTAQRDLEIYNTVKGIDYFDIDFNSAQTTHWVTNVIRMPNDDFDQLILEHKYRFHTGERAPTFFKTFAFMHSEKISIPDFALYPHGEAPENAGKGISFNANPDFSKKYILTAKDEEEVRRVFSDSIVSFLLENDTLILSCSNDFLKVELSNSEWKSKALRGNRVKIQHFAEFIDAAEMLFSLFRESLR